MTDKELCKIAIKASENSYSPYSGCKVGASLLCKNEKVYFGCNVENSSYGATNCAERTAIFSAVANGDKSFEKIAVCGIVDGEIKDSFLPCGICLQVLCEFCPPEFEILVVKSHNADFDIYTLAQLLPKAFKLKI